MKSFFDDPTGVRLNAIHYGRVSTDKQEMERQDRTLELYSDTHGLNVLTRLSDPDVSGSIPFAERDAGAQLLELLRQFPDLQIITTEQDRIGRDTVDQIQTIRHIWKSRATPHFVLEGGALPRTDENEFKMEIRASIAQYERNKIKSRIRDKFRGKRAAGELCGTVTYGWNVRYKFGDGHEIVRANAFSRLERENQSHLHSGLISSRPEDNAEEQKWIHHMIARRGEGWTDWAIAKELNSLGIPTKRAGETLKLGCATVTEKPASGLWQDQQIKKLLASQTLLNWLNSAGTETSTD